MDSLIWNRRDRLRHGDGELMRPLQFVSTHGADTVYDVRPASAALLGQVATAAAAGRSSGRIDRRLDVHRFYSQPEA